MQFKGCWILATAIIPLALLGGCVIGGRVQLPPKMAEVERAKLVGIRFEQTVGLRRAQRPDRDVDSLVNAIQRARLFKQFDYVDRLTSNPDIEVSIRFAHGTGNVIPMVTLLTFGAVALRVDGRVNIEITIEAGPLRSVGNRLTFSYPSDLVLGWGPVATAEGEEWEGVHTLWNTRYQRAAEWLAMEFVRMQPVLELTRF